MLPPEEHMVEMLTEVIGDVVRESSRPQNVEELTKILGGLNHIFLSEAQRLNMTEVPAMPDPADTASKLSAFVGWAGGMA